jgi:hypothetical protein
MTIVATLIGDVVGSRTTSDRAGLHASLTSALDRVNGLDDPDLAPVTPLRITVGDEFQGAFATVGAALHAALALRIGSGAELRHGIGWGAVDVLSENPRVEDGPGWWAARAAIEQVEEAEGRAPDRTLRTAYVSADDVDSGPQPRAINAALVTRDELVARLDARGLSVLAGILSGMSQQGIAAELGISASAVSQRVRRDGLGAILASDALLRDVR